MMEIHDGIVVEVREDDYRRIDNHFTLDQGQSLAELSASSPRDAFRGYIKALVSTVIEIQSAAPATQSDRVSALEEVLADSLAYPIGFEACDFVVNVARQAKPHMIGHAKQQSPTSVEVLRMRVPADLSHPEAALSGQA